MKFVIIPYTAHRRPTGSVDDGDIFKSRVQRLSAFMGRLPLRTKIVMDHYAESRQIANLIEAMQPAAETLVYPWLNPGVRKRGNVQQFEQMVHYLLRLDISLVILVVSATFAATYADIVVREMKIPGQINSRELAHGALCLIDAKAADPLKLIAV